MTERGRGVISVEPETGRTTSLSAPKGPAMDAGYWDVEPAGFSLGGLPNVSEDSNLREAILLHARPDSEPTVYTLAQSWNHAAPNPRVLFETPSSAWKTPAARPWEEARTGQVIVSPNGYTLCAALYDPSLDAHYLVERDTREHSLPSATGPRRTSSGIDVASGSIQYSPDGAKIAFVNVARSEEDRELRLLYSGADDMDGRVLATGLASDTIAFDPEGRRIAALANAADGGAPDVVIIDIYQGQIVSRIGKGLLSTECWAPSGSYLVVARLPDGVEGRGQLWAVPPGDPSQQIQITDRPDGVIAPYALSRDGATLAATIGARTSPAIIFVPLREFF